MQISERGESAVDISSAGQELHSQRCCQIKAAEHLLDQGEMQGGCSCACLIAGCLSQSIYPRLPQQRDRRLTRLDNIRFLADRKFWYRLQGPNAGLFLGDVRSKAVLFFLCRPLLALVANKLTVVFAYRANAGSFIRGLKLSAARPADPSLAHTLLLQPNNYLILPCDTRVTRHTDGIRRRRQLRPSRVALVTLSLASEGESAALSSRDCSNPSSSIKFRAGSHPPVPGSTLQAKCVTVAYRSSSLLHPAVELAMSYDCKRLQTPEQCFLVDDARHKLTACCCRLLLYEAGWYQLSAYEAFAPA